MPSLQEAASELKRWAMKNRMMGMLSEDVGVDADLIKQTFGAIGLSFATKTLQNRQISYIWIDDQDDKIVVCTKTKMNARETKALGKAAFPTGSNDTYPISFVHGSYAQVGGKPGIANVPPYYVHGERYSCGSSIYIASHKGAGTLGALVRTPDGQLYGLSNNHISGGCNYAALQLPILAPGLMDVAAGERDPETIGHHAMAYPFVDGLPEVVNAAGNVDAALFKIANEDRVTSQQQKFYDTPTSIQDISVGMNVEKVGRTTGRTTGIVIGRSFGFDPVIYELDIIEGRKIVFFENVFIVQGTNAPFAEMGDSGSLIVHKDADGNRHAVGLVFAGTSTGLTFVTPIARILNHFGAALVGNQNV